MQFAGISNSNVCTSCRINKRWQKNGCWFSKNSTPEQYLLTRNILLAHTLEIFDWKRQNGIENYIILHVKHNGNSLDMCMLRYDKWRAWIELYGLQCCARFKWKLNGYSLKVSATGWPMERAPTGVYKLKQWWWFHQFTLFFRKPTTEEWVSERGVHNSGGVYDGRNWQSRKA